MVHSGTLSPKGRSTHRISSGRDVSKPNVTTKRVEEIEDIQNRVRKLAAEYKSDFTKPPAIDRIIEKDLEATVYSLEIQDQRYLDAAQGWLGLATGVRLMRNWSESGPRCVRIPMSWL
jgi:hypothetical protein